MGLLIRMCALSETPPKSRQRIKNGILKIIYKENSKLKTGKIAQRIRLPASTTTELIQELADEGLLDYRKYYPVQLSTQGNSVVEQLLQNHRILEVFLVNTLRLKLDFACEQATRLEDAADPLTISRLCSWLDHPARCPHGHPIKDPCPRG